MTNLPLQFSPSPGPLLATACSIISPTIRTGSHHHLSHHTVAWLSLTSQFGAIPFALATYSALLPVVSIVVQPDLSAATPLCKVTLSDSSFVSFSLPQILHHRCLLHTPAIFDFISLDLDWFLDHYTSGLQASTAAVLTPAFPTSCFCSVLFSTSLTSSLSPSNCPAYLSLFLCLLISTVESSLAHRPRSPLAYQFLAVANGPYFLCSLR